jgi:hypothetical protein
MELFNVFRFWPNTHIVTYSTELTDTEGPIGLSNGSMRTAVASTLGGGTKQSPGILKTLLTLQSRCTKTDNLE